MTLASKPFVIDADRDSNVVSIGSAVTTRITASDRAQAIFYLKGRLEREKAPVRRQAWLRMIREMEAVG